MLFLCVMRLMVSVVKMPQRAPIIMVNDDMNKLEWALGRAHTFAYHKIGH